MRTLQRLLLLAGMGLFASVSSPGLYAQSAASPEAVITGEPADAGKKPRDFEDSIKKFEEQDKVQPPPQDGVVFVGSSSLRKWTKLAADFSEIPAINRGFGGSVVADSVKFADRIVIPYKPRVVVFYAGGNDLERGLTPAQVLEQYKAFDEKVWAALPAVTIVHISLNPTITRAKHDPEVKETNRLLADYSKSNPHIVFIETYSKMTGPDGLAQKEWMLSDGIHLNETGYKKWKDLIKPVILETYQKAGTKP